MPVSFVFCLFPASGVRTRKGRRRPRGSPANCRAGVVFEATEQGAEERRIAQRYAKHLMVHLHHNMRVYIIFASFANLPTNMQKLNNILYIELFPDKLMELTYPEKTGSDISHISGIDMTEDRHTNTENTTENIITKDYPLPAEAAAVFKDQIHYEALLSDLHFKKTAVDELVNIAAEVLTSNKKNDPSKQRRAAFISSKGAVPQAQHRTYKICSR